MSGLREMVDVFYEHVSSDDFSERRIEQGIRAVIEALATEAERQERQGVMGSLGTYCLDCPGMIQDFLRTQLLPSDTEATDAGQHHQQNR
jgi:hypothetical protein